MLFTPNLLTSSIFRDNATETSIDFSKHLGYLGIYPGLKCLVYCSGKLGEDEMSIGTVHETSVCHIPVPVIENELYLSKNT